MLGRKLMRTAWQYKAQFISMIIMTVIGVGVFLGFNIEWKSLDDDIGTFLRDTRYADYRLYSESGFGESDIEAIRELDGIDAATRYLSVNAEIKDTRKTLTLNVCESYNVSTMLITSGAEYDQYSDGIWLSDRFAAENGITIGDRMTLIYRGAQIDANVVGLCKSGENMICVADSNQLMPDFETHGFAYISPHLLEAAIGTTFYTQINLLSDMDEQELKKSIGAAVDRTVQVVPKSLHTPYAGAQSEIEEGKTMGSILPVLFLAIAILTMVTTMHRIAANEKVQIGTLKALGLRDRKILMHYTSYGLLIGLIGTAGGILLGYGIAALIVSPNGMQSTYFDLPSWKLSMPVFAIPVMLLTVVLMTLISLLSVRRMLRGTTADALRPYTPKAVKKSRAERLPLVDKLSFGAKWNLRDVLRHKTRSAMTLLGVFGCMLLIVGALGMNDTMNGFLDMLDKTANYSTKVTLSEEATNEDAAELAEKLGGDWQATSGINLSGKTVALDIYNDNGGLVRFLTESADTFSIEDDGVYLCLRLKDVAKIGDSITFSPYGSDKGYTVRVAGYFRSPVSESIVMSCEYADRLGIEYHIGAIYTDLDSGDIAASDIISAKQDKATIMDTYDTFMELMQLMIALFIAAAVILGIVVLYDLGIMSYVERKRELSTLKVLGFRDCAIGRLLVGQNIWLTAVGVLLGLPGGIVVLKILIVALCSEYELQLQVSALSCIISIALTFAVSLIVGIAVARKNKRIDMVEALKFSE